MYSEYYGLTFNPFDKQQLTEKERYESKDFSEATKRLNYLKDIQGIGVFTGKSGIGKSYTLKCFASSLNPNLYDIRYMCLTTVSVKEFYKGLCSALGLSVYGGKSVLFCAVKEQIYSMSTEKGAPLILVIDEAQFLPQSILNDLRMLMNFNYDTRNCFTMILSGENYLNRTLKGAANDSLRQRILVHYNFQGLSPDEVTKYIVHKLEKAGGSKALINDAALTAIASSAQGCPRVIDGIMREAISIGAQNEKKVIDQETIEAAIEMRQIVYQE